MRWQKEQEFLRLQQGSMTVEGYTNKFVKLSRFVTSVAMDEVSRTRRYEKNLAPKARTSMYGIPSTSFQQAYDRALSVYDSVLATDAEEGVKSNFVKRPYVTPSAPQKRQKYEAHSYTLRDQGQAKRDLSYYKCGKANHPGTTCVTGTPITCYTCKASGHKSIDCPQKPETEAPKVDAPKAGRVFVMSRAEADANPDVVTGTFLVHSFSAFVLFYTGASMSFVSESFFVRAGLTSSSSIHTSISLPTGEIVSCSVLFKDVPVSIAGVILPADLVQLKLGEFDMILGMDWLSGFLL
ncbi:uncharacterized protein LOC141614505 [Silene latifolia]|uniref:uncharacterized protein LOC141614505 n=1 Tax=Silene latifolia TaxID=37657 RepID=UPI003D77F3D7